MVHTAHIPKLWEQVIPILEPALVIFNTHDISDAKKDVMSGSKQLWVDYDNLVQGSAITEFVSYPKGLWLKIWIFGVRKEAKIAWEKFEEKFIEFAKLSGCVGIEHCGRPGWERRNPLHKKISVIYRMAL